MKLFIIFFFLCMLSIYGQIESNIEIRFQQAMQEEQIVGNLEQALFLYQEILKEPDLTDTISINIQLRMAICYKKLGNEVEAKKIYDALYSNANTPQEIKNLANVHSGDIEKRSEIHSLKVQLKSLQESNQKDQLEKKVKELQDKIQELENSRSSILNSSKESKKEVSQTEEKDTVAKHLHQDGERFYNQGQLKKAQETLKNSLSIDKNNTEAQQLLDVIDKILKQQQEKQPLSSEPLVPKEDVNGTTIYSAKTYDPVLLWKRWKFSEKQIPQENIWSHNLKLLIKSQLLPEQWKKPADIQYKDKKFYINQTTENHNKLEKFWNSILPNHAVFSTKIDILKSTWSNIENQGLYFSTENSGIIHSQVNSEWKERFLQQSKKNFNILAEDTFHVLENQKGQWDNIKEIPLVQGQNEQSYNFKIFKEGFYLELNVENLKNIQLSLRYQKLQRPIPFVQTHQGLFQSPIFLTQEATIKIDMQFSQDTSYLIGTFLLDKFLLDNMINTDSDLFLFLLVQLHVQKLSDFLQDSPPVRKENSIEKDKITQPHNINFLQVQESPSYLAEFRKNVETNRNTFLLNYFNDIIKEKKLDASLEILQNDLIVYGSEESQKCIDKTIQLLHDNRKTQCKFTINIYSKLNKNILTLPKSPIIQEIDSNNGYHIYAVPKKHYDSILKEELLGWSLSYELNDIYLDNLQKSIFKNTHIRSFIENIECKEQMPIVQTNILEIPQGIILDLRVVLLGSEGDIFFTPSLYSIKNESLITPKVQTPKKIVFPFPDIDSISENFHWKFQKDYFYIISGLKSKKTSNQFCIIIIPEIHPYFLDMNY